MISPAPAVELRPPEPEEIDLLHAWIAEPENNKWLEIGTTRPFSLVQSKLLLERDSNYVRFFSPAEAPPIGLVAFSNINRHFSTAMAWYLLGDRRYAGHGCTRSALSALLEVGFGELGLQCVHAWTVESNIASAKILEKCKFRFIGRQRQSHVIDGLRMDRLLFDLLKSEFTAERG